MPRLSRRLCSVALLVGVALGGQTLPVATADLPSIDLVTPTVETVPMHTGGDSADDPAIWVHPTDPAQSLVIVNNKRGALETYDLRGQRVQRLRDNTTFWGNVDTRPSVQVGTYTRDLVAVVHRGVQFYSPDPLTRQLQFVTEGTALATSGEGLCLYRSPLTLRTYVIVISRAGRLRQYELTDLDNDGLLSGRLVRDFQVGSEAEGCVADDKAQALYVSQEDVALWRYGAEPTAGSTRTAIDTVVAAGGTLEADIEGATLAEDATGRTFLFASAQRLINPSASYFTSYELFADGTWTPHRAFRVTNGPTADDCDKTDGIAAYAGNLGPDFPYGIFVCQDNNNNAPGTGYQDVKYVPLESILPHLIPPPPPPSGPEPDPEPEPDPQPN